MKIDLHMHSTVSDGTDAPLELLGKVREAGIDVFAVTDHDDIAACGEIVSAISESDSEEKKYPKFIPGAEFAAKDELGRYHIVGLGYDPEAGPIRALVDDCRSKRVQRVRLRLEYLEEVFGMTLPEEEKEALFKLKNPGRPHIGNLLVKYGYAPDRNTAIREYVNKTKTPGVGRIGPQQAIEAILASGGVPVLAHAILGDGNQMGDRKSVV